MSGPHLERATSIRCLQNEYFRVRKLLDETRRSYEFRSLREAGLHSQLQAITHELTRIAYPFKAEEPQA